METDVFGRIRAFGRRLPMLKRVFLPLWVPFTHGCWTIRNLLTHRRPIRIPAGNDVALLHPEGQIAEVLWVSDFEAAERGFVTGFARPGMRVVNIGANSGLYTILMAKITGPSGEVHAFEPSTTTFALLERNLRLNRLTNVLASNLALSDAVGRLILRSDPRNQSLDGHRFVEAMNQSAPVAAGDEVIACDTLDNYFSRIADGKPLSSVDLIIMDVEGAEWAVLKGANQTLRASPNVLLVLECSRNRHEVEKLLAQEGFRFYVWNPEVPCLDSADFVGAASKGTVVAYRGNPRAFFSRQ